MKKERISKLLLIVAAFFIPLVILCAVFMINGIVPFGDQTLLVSDSSGQYIQFWTHLRGIMNGERDALYTFSKTLGGSMAGLFAYYLASPLNIIFLFFSEEQLPIAMNLLILLKLSLCGLTFAVFTQKTRPMGWKTLLFSAAYALCAYNIGYCWSLMWLDGVIMLPIIALGIHYISDGKKPWVYIFSLGVAIISSYYIGFMLCIFSLFYYIYLTVLKNKTIKTASKKNAISFALASLCAGALSSAMLLPGLLSMRGGKRAPIQSTVETSLRYHIDQVALRFFPECTVDYDKVINVLVPVIISIAVLCLAGGLFVIFTKRISVKAKKGIGFAVLGIFMIYLLTKDSFIFTLVKMFTGTTTANQIINGFPNVFTGLLMLLLCLLYFANRGIERRERVISAILMSVLMLSFSFELINTIWHGFTKNNWFNFRYSFIFSFLLLIFAMRAMDKLRSISKKRLALCSAAILVTIVIGIVSELDFFRAEQAIISAIAVILFSALLYLHSCENLNKKVLTTVVMSILLLHAGDLCYNANRSVESMIGMYDITLSEYEQNYSQMSNDIKDVAEDNNQIFRIRKDYSINNNDPMALGYNGLSHFSSTDHTDVIDFMRNMGASFYSNVWANAEGDFTRAADSLLCVKYYITSEDYLDFNNSDGDKAYENPYALPLGFIADASALMPVSQSDCTFEYQNDIFQKLDDGGEIFTKLQIKQDAKTEIEASAADSPQKEHCLDFTIKIESDDPVYIQITDDNAFYGEAKVYANDKLVYTYDNATRNSVILCGVFAPGEMVTVTITSQEELFDVECVKVYTESSQVLQEYHESLTSQPCQNECITDSHIITTAEVTQDDAYLVYSIPYEECWKITVDGEKIEPSEALDMFLAVPLEQGEHTVELRYVPSGLFAGIAITALVLAVVAGAMVYDRKKHIFN